MKTLFYKTCYVVLFVVIVFKSNAQYDSLKIDSLKKVLLTEKEDTNKVNTFLHLSKSYMSISSEKAITYSISARDLAVKIKYYRGSAFALKNIGMGYYNQSKYAETIENWNQSYLTFVSLGDKVNEALLLNNIGAIYMNQGNDTKALDYYFKSLKIAEKVEDKHTISIAFGNIATIYKNNQFTYDKAIEYYLKALALSKEIKDKNVMGGVLVNIGEIYFDDNKYDSALYYFKESLEAYKNTENIPYSLNDIGATYRKKERYDLAEKYHMQALLFAEKLNLQLDIAQSYLGLGDTYYKNNNFEKALNAYENSKLIAGNNDLKKELKEAYSGLSICYAALNDFTKAYQYQKLYSDIKDTLLNLDIAQKINQFQINFDIQKKQGQIDLLTKDQELQKLELKRQKFTRDMQYSVIAAFLLVAIFLYINNRQKQKAKAKIESAYSELKSTQVQLIQSEKMASLGELTAGIAHEIQNPLNFVNNFSEVNREMIDEATEEIDKGNYNEVKNILNDIKDNSEKINHHGKRADAIVKGMLQHSRRTSGTKEPTDINALCDEYLRLSYHGMRAKDKEFNATMKTDFDNSLGKINIVPQDIGRVLLNLYNNAFYAVNEKASRQPNGYVPTISVQTKKINDKVEIKISDNGNGIPQNIVDKIFQPFFTTKPTGEGTGLGLSLSYDIIKAHGGEIKVESKEGEGTTFIIQLPNN